MAAAGAALWHKEGGGGVVIALHLGGGFATAGARALLQGALLVRNRS